MRRITLPWQFALYFSAMWMVTGVYQSFISVYFKASGYSDGVIGLLLGIAPLVTIIAQPFWGTIADRAKWKNTVLLFLHICALAVILSFPAAIKNIWLLGAAVCLYAFFQTSMDPLATTITLEYITPRGIPFGPIRMCGTVAFAFMAVFAGTILSGNISFVPYLAAIFMVFAFFAATTLPKIAGHQRNGSRVPWTELLKNKKLMQLFGLLFALQFTMAYFYTFFPIHFINDIGGTSVMLGWAYFISAMCEIPFLLFSDRIFDKMRAGRMMLISGIAIVFRFFLLGAFSNPYLAMATQVFHGFGFIVFSFAIVKHINLYVPDELKASGQMMMSLVSFGLARTSGSFLGGQISTLTGGIQGGFWVLGGFLAAVLIVYTPIILRDGDGKMRLPGRL